MKAATLRERVDKVFKNTPGINRILLVNTNSQDPNFIYLTDFTSGLFEGSFLLVTKAGVTLFTYPLEYETAKQQAVRGMRIVNMDSEKKFRLLESEIKGAKIGVNERFVPYRSYKNLKKRLKPKSIVDVSEAFSKARETKDSEEIKRIREGARITKKAVSEMQKRLKAGMTERELAIEFDSLMLRLGSERPSFPTIVCFGANAALPHHMPDNTRLKYGDFVLIDAGAVVKNYASDITRTMLFGKDKGRVKEYGKKLAMLNTVKAAQSKAISAIKQGAKGGKIHMIAQNIIDKADNGTYKGTFIHALGHSIGIEVHDGYGRFLSPKSSLVLKDGMVTSVEPGIYLPGFGGVRFEDDVLVTKNGPVIL
ncbi:MAG: aminopeptidase P family protein [Candidatus Micrarchaeota archaeon]|nr:aminopeptidase P family protein [Candidatus Micrarchaeota archaeon]